MLTFRSFLRTVTAAICDSRVSHLFVFVVTSAVLTSCVGYSYTYELIPGRNRTGLTEAEIAEACTVVDQIAQDKGMQRLTPFRPEVLRGYTKDRYIFPIGEDVTNFGLTLFSGGRGLEFGATSANSGDFLATQLLHETVASFDSHFGRSRVIKHPHPYRLGLY
jgi:hypothetical protein